MTRAIHGISDANAAPDSRWSCTSRRVRIVAGIAVLAVVLATTTPASAQSTSVPARPARPTATSVDHAAVTISWADPGDSSITGYQILRRDRSTVPVGPFVVINADTGSAATSYTDDTVEASRSYAYRIKARNANGLSPRSRSGRTATADAPSEQIEETIDGSGGSTVSDDYPDSTSTTGSVSVAGTTNGDIETPNDRDWFAVTLVAGTDYQIDLEGEPTSSGTLGDPYLRGIHDSDGNLIPNTTNDDDGFDVNSRVMFRPTTSGVHHVAAGAWGTEVGTYTLSVTVRVTDDYLDNSSTTGAVVVDGSVTGDIEVASDTDWFAVTLTAGTTYRIDLKGASTSDGTLWDPWLKRLYNRHGTRLWETANDDGGTGLNSRLNFTAGSTGVHYIEAGAVGSDTGTYTLSVTLISSQATCIDNHCS